MQIIKPVLNIVQTALNIVWSLFPYALAIMAFMVTGLVVSAQVALLPTIIVVALAWVLFVVGSSVWAKHA